ncbi:tRNA (N(6)-L-threonylcarbamoyladenosine(37)-C(2))-methylthiotransferase MtaB [Denitrobacterium detoxificans]|uniref:tRNA (N(6)-L-threonylcarbamoyladenosine(37)-C(2))- methylthiotransferase MtaB n=1 Tax=Denitrobacterium detoxificans TaxID=79604 RepID=UPI0026E97326|nr:tRNA (N(6)-L-threonylcarbamoyladenosine(37)-C(2))-methylthiotransferase MtaB [Denitrobacterium detoxificans]MBE6466083.1 tRNA (N(6)-L-threonylcarbamoyladenosine(37)-C(2))-methylthiotransferase MtaB [Denitrobacterium detoxificans]
MRARIVNLGCKVNRVESDAFAADLRSFGFSLIDGDPECVIVNTCTVTGEAEKKTRKAVRRELRDYPNANVIVTGCAAAIDANEFASMSERVIVVPKNQVVDVCLECCGLSRESIVPAASDVRFGEGFPSRVGLKIQDGCNNACTYCIVHVARGRAWSVPLRECVEEARKLAEAGAREIVLTGINLGTYRDGDATLATVVRTLREQVPSVRIRISSVEPRDVTDDLLQAIAQADGMVCRHLHLPLQSGSTRVLRQMARPYSAERFLGIVERAHQAIPGLSLSTDIIVGFPGETDEDFQETMRVARLCQFSKIHVFRYSRRVGTPAAERDDQVDPIIAAQRADELARLGDELRMQEARKRLGSRELVLVEQNGLGTTESYYQVKLDGSFPDSGLVSCELQTVDENGVFSV